MRKKISSNYQRSKLVFIFRENKVYTKIDISRDLFKAKKKQVMWINSKMHDTGIFVNFSHLHRCRYSGRPGPGPLRRAWPSPWSLDFFKALISKCWNFSSLGQPHVNNGALAAAAEIALTERRPSRRLGEVVIWLWQASLAKRESPFRGLVWMGEESS